MKKSNFWRGISVLLILVLSITGFGTALAFHREGDVNLFLGTLPPVQAVSDDTNYYPSAYGSMEEMRADLETYLIQSQEEGSVLLRNEDKALPLGASAKVTLFGYAAATPVYHGGSGGPANTGVNLYDALKEAGVSVNEAAYNAIVAAGGSRTKTGLIGEIPATSYSGVTNSFSDYSDAAIYVMSRFGGEEGDLNHGLQGDWQEGPADIPELRLHPEEIETLKLIQDAGLKGTSIGNARVSEKHANFITTAPGVRSEDYRNLISYVQNTVSERFGVWLEPEIEFLGFED